MTETPLEDPNFGGHKPTIDLTPLDIWNFSFEDVVGKQEWRKTQKHVAERVGHACELCGASSNTPGVMGNKAHKHKIEFRFDHDLANNIARLKRILYVCTGCQQAIHLRQTELKSRNMPAGRGPAVGAYNRLKYFHDLTDDQVKDWLDRELNSWKSKQEIGYPEAMDLDILEDVPNRLWQ